MPALPCRSFRTSRTRAYEPVALVSIWHARRIRWYAAFTAVPILFYFFCPTSLSILWRICVYIHNLTPYRLYMNYRCYQITLQWNILTQTGSAGLAVTERIRDIGQNVLQSSFQTGSNSSPRYFRVFFLIPFLEEIFMRNIITTLRTNYITIICVKDNNGEFGYYHHHHL
jgi:hypothetical protein